MVLVTPTRLANPALVMLAFGEFWIRDLTTSTAEGDVSFDAEQQEPAFFNLQGVFKTVPTKPPTVPL